MVPTMSYSDFTLEILRRDYGMKVKDEALFNPVESLEASAWLVQALEKGHDLALFSEKARSEFIVAPVLMACRELLNARIHIFSGVWLDADPDRGLKGECDFILARSTSAFVLQSPLMLVLEAKKNDIEAGLGQCGAQMLGAKIYNERDGNPAAAVYGCVTTGEFWQFLKLENGTLTIHPERFSLKEIGKILWFMVQSLRKLDRQAATDTAA